MKKNYIAGEWVAGADCTSNRNPSEPGDVIGEYSNASSIDVHNAINSATSSQAVWPVSTPQTRFDILDNIGSEILARQNELGELLSREEGKPLAEGIGEAGRAGYIFKYYAGEALRLAGTVLASVRAGVDVQITREPLGVVGLITPWNFPIAIPAWKIAPALCYGNSVILKPSEKTPASAWELAKIIAESGLPDGVFNLVMGDGNVGKKLVESLAVNGVSFTGSVNTGASIAQTCSRRMAKYQLEMGGKNPLVVLDDADVDLAIEGALNGAYFSAGQRCTASSRLIVTDGVYDQFVDGLTKRLSELTIGSALDKATHLGPLVDQQQLDSVLSYVDKGTQEGATLVYGGKALDRPEKGFFMTPALFTDTDNSMAISTEEIFGPVATVARVSGYEDALKIANDTEFGLSAGIYTRSLAKARHFQRHSQAGMVMVNLPTAGVDYHVPFGGRKNSSNGSREQGSYAAEFYTTVKTTYLG